MKDSAETKRKKLIKNGFGMFKGKTSFTKEDKFRGQLESDEIE